MGYALLADYANVVAAIIAGASRAAIVHAGALAEGRINATYLGSECASASGAARRPEEAGAAAKRGPLIRIVRFKRGRTAMREAAFQVIGMDLSGYMVEDAARAIAFYRDVLGLEPTLIYPDNRGAEYEFADGTTFGLWGGGGAVMPFQPSNGILFAVDDFDAAVAAVKAHGIAVHMQHETPVCHLAMISDTEGNIVTLHKRKSP